LGFRCGILACLCPTRDVSFVRVMPSCIVVIFLADLESKLHVFLVRDVESEQPPANTTVSGEQRKEEENVFRRGVLCGPGPRDDLDPGDWHHEFALRIEVPLPPPDLLVVENSEVSLFLPILELVASGEPDGPLLAPVDRL